MALSASSRSTRKICTICEVTFSNSTNLNKHVRAFHPGCVKCDICNEPVVTDVQQHLEKTHKLSLKHTKLVFKNEIDFQLWKVEEEKRLGLQYVSTSGTKKTSACVAKRYFICRRSGRCPSQSKKKTRSSVGCGVKCPARMVLTVDHSGRYLVDYQQAHFGHDKYLPATEAVVAGEDTLAAKPHCVQVPNKDGHLDERLSSLPIQPGCDSLVEVSAIDGSTSLPYLESLWSLRNSKRFYVFKDRVHMHLDRSKGILLVSELCVVVSGIARPCFLSSLLFYEVGPPSIYVRGVELLPDNFQVGDLRHESGFFGLLGAVLNAPKCPGAADQTEAFDVITGYLDTTYRWRHENCPIFSTDAQLCDGCHVLRRTCLLEAQKGKEESQPSDCSKDNPTVVSRPH